MSFSTNTSTVPSRSWECNLRHHFMGTISWMWFSYPPNLLDSFFHVLRPLFIPEAGITTSLRNRFLVCSFFTYCFLQKLPFCVITQNTNVWLCLITHLASSGSGMFGKHTRFPPVQCSPDGTSQHQGWDLLQLHAWYLLLTAPAFMLKSKSRIQTADNKAVCFHEPVPWTSPLWKAQKLQQASSPCSSSPAFHFSGTDISSFLQFYSFAFFPSKEPQTKSIRWKLLETTSKF